MKVSIAENFGYLVSGNVINYEHSGSETFMLEFIPALRLEILVLSIPKLLTSSFSFVG